MLLGVHFTDHRGTCGKDCTVQLRLDKWTILQWSRHTFTGGRSSGGYCLRTHHLSILASVPSSDLVQLACQVLVVRSRSIGQRALWSAAVGVGHHYVQRDCFVVQEGHCA